MTDAELIKKANDWLSSGGLFNAECMLPTQTAQLIVDLRDRLEARTKVTDEMVERFLKTRSSTSLYTYRADRAAVRRDLEAALGTEGA